MSTGLIKPCPFTIHTYCSVVWPNISLCLIKIVRSEISLCGFMYLQKYGYSPHLVVPHGSYLLNCGSSDPKILHESRESLVDDLLRCRMLGLPHFNFHPGIILLYFTFLLNTLLIGPIPWGHSGPLCHTLLLSSLSLASWTLMRRRHATVPLATPGEWARGGLQ